MSTPTEPRTISELAAALGVSSMTIHRAVAGKPDISPETRSRILAEVERLGWRPNIAARSLRQKKTFTLGILVSNVAASFLPEVLLGIDRTAEEKGYHTFVSMHDHDPERAIHHLRTLASKGVDGIVHYPTESGGEVEVLNQVHRTTPVVTVMREAAGFRGPAILVDDPVGGRLAAEHLLTLGHTRIGYLGYGDGGFSHLRRQGFEAALRAAGVEVRPEWTLADLRPADEQIPARAARLLSGPERPTAFFCASDRLAARLFQAALARGIRIPDDLSVVGYNGDPWGTLLAVPLTTVAQPRLEVGASAAERVLDPAVLEAGPSRLVLEPQLVARGSTAPMPRSGAIPEGPHP